MKNRVDVVLSDVILCRCQSDFNTLMRSMTASALLYNSSRYISCAWNGKGAKAVLLSQIQPILKQSHYLDTFLAWSLQLKSSCHSQRLICSPYTGNAPSFYLISIDALFLQSSVSRWRHFLSCKLSTVMLCRPPLRPVVADTTILRTAKSCDIASDISPVKCWGLF